ncbi:plant cysteine oxidase 2-like [Punica granatum]|uniref:cysteine dioxygenase n=2 Tax=Punica granatum TaxID=22663 RepID=A0A218WA50_PUNGR|nr:plant cysteine oxidase 2-like [Punica granatum]OWM69757.1 hypothetical protein CDL15_Pgr025606 [Punica granatum]PKI33270.1 hypothetical protein CRG98_046344 [Punica granatum]
MGITTTVAGRKGKEFRELSRETTATTNSKSKKNRRRQRKMMLPIQRLFDTCREVFAGSGTNVVPSPQEIENLKTVLDGIRPEHLELSPEMPCFRVNQAEGSPMITYLHLYESEKFSMGIFCLPPSGVIPLHNHPGMTVFSKILFGTMHIKSYDWVVGAPNSNSVVNPPQAEPHGPRLAKLKVDSNFTAPCATSILYPADGGNMHRFTAVTACAVLDVLGPPYSDPEGRHCTYYDDHPFSRISVEGVSIPEEEREGYAWLEERERPEGISVVGAPYRGPMFVEN